MCLVLFRAETLKVNTLQSITDVSVVYLFACGIGSRRALVYVTTGRAKMNKWTAFGSAVQTEKCEHLISL